MVASIISIVILVGYFALSITLFIRKIVKSKKSGLPLSCCSCSNCTSCSSNKDADSCSALKNSNDFFEQKHLELGNN